MFEVVMSDYYEYFFDGKWYLSINGQLKPCPTHVVTREQAVEYAENIKQKKEMQ
jgi:intein-encoded DNA endonuclease-like protein